MPKLTIDLTDAEMAFAKEQAQSACYDSTASCIRAIVQRELARRIAREPEWRGEALRLAEQLSRSEQRARALKELLREELRGQSYYDYPEYPPEDIDDGIPF